ncbi:hypothetical protein I4U23_006293 [Adineta vaga]|nr:hypothetical protein I4U23_006293 [Adineta vaga]
MPRRNCLRWIRIYLIFLLLCILLTWFVPSMLLNIHLKSDNIIEYYENFVDNHIYPPPWYLSNWTINDYFLRKDKLKKLEEQYAIEQNQKIILENTFSNRKKDNHSNYIILEYTNVFKQPKFCGQTQDSIFGKQCPYQNCRYTCNRSLSNSADVLLMHHSDINFDQLPKERNPDQIWLFWHDEPGGIVKRALSYQFNWTISYRLSAEANIGAYGITLFRDKFLRLKEFNSYIDKQFKTRQANAVWFISNCQPKARINFYLKFRSSYPFIRVHGKCVSQNTTTTCSRHSQCETYELTRNKFYLAFESQSCRDYITEKFWRSLAFGIIPIVFGPRDKQYLERIAPPKSFIFAEDFLTITDLAEHLIEIDRNRTLFEEYHRWRRLYQILYRSEDIEHYRFCELCYRLNTNYNRIYYQNLNDFFLEDC